MHIVEGRINLKLDCQEIVILLTIIIIIVVITAMSNLVTNIINIAGGVPELGRKSASISWL